MKCYTLSDYLKGQSHGTETDRTGLFHYLKGHLISRKRNGQIVWGYLKGHSHGTEHVGLSKGTFSWDRACGVIKRDILMVQKRTEPGCFII